MSTDPNALLRKVNCPGCGVPCTYSIENPNRPFCSARCKNNDFGAWADERFSVDADVDSGDVDGTVNAHAIAPAPRKH